MLNKTTDSIWKEIKATVKRTAKSLVNADKAQATTQLEDFLKPYWDSEELFTHTQTANFKEMFGKYAADTNLPAKAETVGVKDTRNLKLFLHPFRHFNSQ